MKTRKNSYSVTNAIVILIMIFSLTTQYQAIFDRISINRVIGAGIILLLFIELFPSIKKGTFIGIFLLVVAAVFAVIVTTNIISEIINWIYVLTTVMLLELISIKNKKEEIIKSIYSNRKLIKFFVIVECASMLIMLLFRVGYHEQWGGNLYFLGLCVSEHTMGALCCLLLSMILLLCIIEKKHNIKFLFYALVPLYAILQCGARVFMIPGFIIIVAIINNTVKKKSIRIISYVLGILIIVFFFTRSMMLTKFQVVISNKYNVANSVLESFTSGRSVFWGVDIKYYLSGNVLELLFGRCFMDVYAINLLHTNIKIWSHNDLIYLLVGGGIISVLCYLYFAIKPIKAVIVPIRYKIVLIIYVFAPMLLNGFMTYQHLLYSFVFFYTFICMKYQFLDQNGSQKTNVIKV